MSTRIDLAVPPFDDALLASIHRISEAVFGQADPEHIRWRLLHMPHASVFTALEDGTLAGFKAGYAMSETKYYSWLGGVHPDFRRQGLASRLMTRQHAWLGERGYALVETATNQENRAMAALNLKHGFLISGTRRYPDNTQILFLKELEQSGQREAAAGGDAGDEDSS